MKRLTVLALLLATLACSTPATPARTAFFVATAADLGTTAYGLSHGYQEANPLGIWGVLGFKVVTLAIAEWLMPERYRSAFYWYVTGVSLGVTGYNIYTLTRPIPEPPPCPPVALLRTRSGTRE